MLTYLIETTEALVATAILFGLLAAYAGVMCEKIGKKIVLFGAIVGTIASIIMSYMKNRTSLVNTGYWNLGIFSITLFAFAVFLVFSIKKIQLKTNPWGKYVAWSAISLLTASVIFYSMPDIWAYPYTFLGTENSMFTTEYLYNLIGYFAGLLLMLLVAVAIWQGAVRLSVFSMNTLLKLALLVNAVRQSAVGLQIMLAKRIIKSNHTLFMIAKFSSNNSDVFIYATIVVAAIIPIILWVQSFHVNEPYRNPAQKRKIRAKWRRTRRWATAAILFMVLSVLNITAVKAYANREVELSPVEEAVVENGNVYVDFEQVSDGHLHRFAYVTESGTQIRFIVIQKPNATSYGIGLDACDICGETGYYEKDGQVVCKLCDVVMNISTIGFKGGCNPIVIDYQIKDGKIVVPIEGLLEYEKVFDR